MKKPTGCPRHLFTAVAATDHHEAGFRTIAHSRELSGLVGEIENLVDGYRAGDPGSPPCRQLQMVPGRGQIYALTVFTPTGPTPEGRSGNYWAETLIVPADWLAASDWDTAAAFEALEWWGPRRPSEIGTDLPAVVLPTPQAGPLDRLAKLVAAVPKSNLYGLVTALVQQSRGLRRLRLLEEPNADPRKLDDVVALLPLLVPPGLRAYRDDDARRCLTWRTRSPRGGMAPAADITGFPAAAADDLANESEGSVVLDLSGRLPAPTFRDRFGERYARWLVEKLAQGRFSDLEALYAGEISGSATAWISGFDGRVDGVTDSATTDTGSAPTDDTSIFEARRAAWQARDAAEGQAWGLLENHRQQLETNLTEFRRELDDAARQATQKWRESLDQQLQEYETRGAQLAASAARSTANRAAGGEGLETRVARLERERDGASSRARGGAWRAFPESDAATGAGHPQRVHLRSEPSWKNWLQRRDAAALVPKIAIGLLILGAVYWGLSTAWSAFQGRTTTNPQATTDAGNETTAPTTDLREQRRVNLLQKLQQRDAATALLRQASGDDDFRTRTNDVLLALTLGEQTARLEEVGPALLQQALGTTVDGQWGRGSSGALRANLPSDCAACSTAADGDLLAWNGPEAGCFLIVHLELEDPPCPGSSPWRAGRAWTETEARRALDLLRTTSSGAGEAIKAKITTLDPTISDEPWVAIGDPSLQQAEMLFDLAYAWTVKDPSGTAPDKIPASRLDELGALLDGLVSSTSDAGGDS